MEPVSREKIEAAWNEICDLDEGGCRELVQRFSQEQPFLVVYLFAQNEHIGERTHEESMMSLTVMIWKLLAAGPPRQVKARVIEKAEAKNIEFLEQMDAGPEIRQTDAAAHLVNSYNQSQLLGFCLEVLMSGNEDTPELAPEGMGLKMLTLKTVIDCLDR